MSKKRVKYIILCWNRKKSTISRYISEMGYPEKEIEQICKHNSSDHVARPFMTSSSHKKHYAVKSVDGQVVNKIFDQWYGPQGCKKFVEIYCKP